MVLLLIKLCDVLIYEQRKLSVLFIISKGGTIKPTLMTDVFINQCPENICRWSMKKRGNSNKVHGMSSCHIRVIHIIVIVVSIRRMYNTFCVTSRVYVICHKRKIYVIVVCISVCACTRRNGICCCCCCRRRMNRNTITISNSMCFTGPYKASRCGKIGNSANHVGVHLFDSFLVRLIIIILSLLLLSLRICTIVRLV